MGFMERKKHLFAKKHPELLHAIQQVEIAQKTLDAVVKSIVEGY